MFFLPQRFSGAVCFCYMLPLFRLPVRSGGCTPHHDRMTKVQWMYIYKLPLLLKSLKDSVQVPGESAIQRLPSHAILIATVTASLPEDQSARLFVNKTDYFLLPGWTDPPQLLLDPCHSADKKIHTSCKDLLSVDTASIQITQLPGDGKKSSASVF